MKAREAFAALCVAIFCTAGTAQAGTFASTDPGDSPEGVVVIADSVFVSTTPLLPWLATGSGEPSVIYRFDRATGQETGRIVVEGERLLGGVQGIAGLAQDGEGRLLANDAQGRVLRFTERPDGSFAQETYATVPDVGPCALGAPRPCSAHPADLAPLVNEITRLPDGTLLLSDSFQAAVWKVPPGGGQAQLLISHRSLVGTAFGPNGISASPDGRYAVLAVSSDPRGNGVLYRFAVRQPHLTEVATYASDHFPDGVDWASENRLYVAMAGQVAIDVVDPWTGARRGRLTDPAMTEPAGIDVDETRGEVLVANHDVDMTPPGPGTVAQVGFP